MATVLPLPLPRTEPGPRDFALAAAILKLSPESTPDLVRGIGPALAPAAAALETLRRVAALVGSP